MSEQKTAPSIHFNEVFAEYEGFVDPEAVRKFAIATMDPQPTYLDGTAVPPTYTAVLVLPALNENMRNAIEDGAITNQTNGLHGVHAEHDVYFHAPLRPNQKVHWNARMRSCSVNRAGTMVTQQIPISDEDGNLLIEHFWSSMAVKSTSDCVYGDPPPDHRYPEEARNHIIGEEVFDVPRDQGRIYFEAAGDPAPHSLSDEAARAEGHPGMILQGMCSFSMITGAVVRLAGQGEPERLRRLAARFSSPVVLGHPLTVQVAEVGTEDDGTYVVAFEARQGETLCVSHGRAEFKALS